MIPWSDHICWGDVALGRLSWVVSKGFLQWAIVRMPSYSDLAGNISTLQHSTNHLILLRVLFKNGAAWPEISWMTRSISQEPKNLAAGLRLHTIRRYCGGKATIFPGDDNSACFSCKAFYTSHHHMVIIPTADLGLGDSAFPASEITSRMKIPAIRINVVKYASLIRGDRACLLRGLLHWKDLPVPWFEMGIN